MLQDIRDNAQGTIAKIIIGVLIVSLSIWGMDAIIGGFTGEPEVATVNGEEVTQREYERMVQIEGQRRLSQMERPDPSLLDEDQIRTNVLESMIQEEVMVQDARAQGLELSDQGVDQLIVSMPRFQVDGEFSQERFTAAVRNLGMGVAEYREALRRQYVYQQIANSIMLGAVVPAEAARQVLAIQGQSRGLHTRTLTADTVAGQVEVTGEEVQAWYEGHQDQFRTLESVDVEYLVLSLDDVAERVEVPEEDIQALYEQKISDMEAAEERRSAHILIEDGDNAEERIATVKERLKEGADFAELAREYSDDSLSAEAGGDLGYLSRGNLGEAYDEALFALEEGEVSGPVETDYGTHFIKLLDVRTSEPTSLDEMRDELRRELANDRAGEEYARLRSELADLAYSEEGLEYPAEQLGLEVQTRTGITREGGEPPFDHQGLVRQLFSGDVLEDGFNTELIDVANNRTVVARVSEHHPENQKPLEQVADPIRQRLVHQETLAALRERADALIEQLEAGEVVPEGDEWTTYQDVTRTQAAVAEPVRSTVFSLPRPQEEDFSYGTTAVEDDLVVIALSDVTDGEVDQDSDQFRNMRQLLARMNGQQEYQAYSETLRERAEVVRP